MTWSWRILNGILLSRGSEIIIKSYLDPKGRQFDLEMKLVDLKQQGDDNITSYIERTEALATKLLGEDFSIITATVRGMSEPAHQHWIKKECIWWEDFEFGVGI